MKVSSLMLALLAAAALPAFAAPDPQETNLKPVRAEMATPAPIGGIRALQLLGLETGLDARDVRMVLTTVANQEYFGFRKDLNTARHFEQALGSDRYDDLIAGKPVALHSPAVLEAARNMAAEESGSRAAAGDVALVAFIP